MWDPSQYSHAELASMNSERQGIIEDLQRENENLRAELERYNDINGEQSYEHVVRERNGWRELCGRWRKCAHRAMRAIAGVDLGIELPPEKLEDLNG